MAISLASGASSRRRKKMDCPGCNGDGWDVMPDLDENPVQCLCARCSGYGYLQDDETPAFEKEEGESIADA